MLQFQNALRFLNLQHKQILNDLSFSRHELAFDLSWKRDLFFVIQILSEKWGEEKATFQSPPIPLYFSHITFGEKRGVSFHFLNKSALKSSLSRQNFKNWITKYLQPLPLHR